MQSASTYQHVISFSLHKPCFYCQQHPLFPKSPHPPCHICFPQLLYPHHHHHTSSVTRMFFFTGELCEEIVDKWLPNMKVWHYSCTSWILWYEKSYQIKHNQLHPNVFGDFIFCHINLDVFDLLDGESLLSHSADTHCFDLILSAIFKTQ